MKIFALSMLLPVISMAQMPMMGTPTHFSNCMPTSEMGFGTAPILFDQFGNTMVNSSSDQVISTRRENGVEEIDYWNSTAITGVDGEIEFRKVRTKVQIVREQNRPSVATSIAPQGGQELVKQKIFEYDQNGRCRVGQNITFLNKDGVVSDVLIDDDASLCDKIVDEGKRNLTNARTLNMCAQAFAGIKDIIQEHIKSYQGMKIQVPGVEEPMSVNAQMAAFSFSSGKSIAVNPEATNALMQKIAQCQMRGGVGMEQPIYGGSNFKPIQSPVTAQPVDVDDAPEALIDDGETAEGEI